MRFNFAKRRVSAKGRFQCSPPLYVVGTMTNISADNWQELASHTFEKARPGLAWIEIYHPDMNRASLKGLLSQL